MRDSHLAGQQPKHWSSPLLYFVSIIFQTALFLGAAAALTFFYLSYRTADFTQSFIISGLALAAPWLLISLLPTFFGLEDNELRREIWIRQIISMLVIIAVLVGLAVSIDFHRELWVQIQSYLLVSVDFVKELWLTLTAYISKGINFLTAFFNEKLLPYFSN